MAETRYRSALLAALAVASAASLATSTAHAQNAADQAAAEALFDQGKVAMAAHNYAEACPKFFESNRLDTGLGTSLWLADCYEQNGQTASAWAEFREAASLAVKANDTAREKVARSRAKALEPKLAHLVLVVPEPARLPALRIARDGTDVTAPLWGTPVPIDPGPHTLVVSAPDHRPATLHVDIQPGPGEQTIEAPVLEEAEAPAPSAEAAPATAGAANEPGRFPLQRALAVGAAVAGVGAAAAASYFGLHAKSELDDSNAGPCSRTTNLCTTAGVADRSAAQSSATASTVLFIVGGAAIAGGAALWFTAPKATGGAAAAPAATAVRVAPWLDPRTGAGVRGVVLLADF